jgi:hypothetical protein
MSRLIFSFAFLFIFSNSFSQQTTGLFQYEWGTEDGYVLWSPLLNGHNIYLMNNCGEVVHSWNSPNTMPANSLYLLDDGTLLYPAKADSATNSPIQGGGGGERIRKIDWDGNVLWDYVYYDNEKRLHHDIEVLPNGNVLAIAWVRVDSADCVAAGRNPDLITQGELWSERIIEVQPNGPSSGDIVWQWDLMDHLIQDFDPAKPNYGVVADHPELLDLNFVNAALPNPGQNDWIHLNSIAYNADLDQIVLSGRIMSEIWIIDHSTTTEEAAGHTGGNYGKGGDFLYRYGNPQAYDRGTSDDQKLWRQHDAHWIQDGLTDAGSLMIFNNGLDRPVSMSEIDVITPPQSSPGVYILESGEAYGPTERTWNYHAPDSTSFYSFFISGARRLPNGNTFICSGQTGRLFEVTYEGDIVWEYVSPVVQWSVLGSSDQIPPTNFGSLENIVFRAERYSPAHPAFVGHDLSTGNQLEADPVIANCLVGVEEDADKLSVEVYPNPTSGKFTVNTDSDSDLLVTDVLGRNVASRKVVSSGTEIDLSHLHKGLYLLHLASNGLRNTTRLVIQ